ncbi:MAG: type I-E CRISPR-associated protein Cse2/CasB [Firmicutes bacterium]|nr:type I-E CRISPR-associated protein Cse2/CasB [Bacillota bacterium]
MNKSLVEENLGQQVGRIAGVICSDNFSTGGRAALRRFTPGGPLAIEFYRFAYRYLPAGWESSMDEWSTLVAGIALMSPNAYDPRVRYGTALAESGYSDLRLERLLQANGEVQRVLFLRSIRFLSQKSRPFNWTDGARFLLTRDASKREVINSSIARDYYAKIDKE